MTDSPFSAPVQAAGDRLLRAVQASDGDAAKKAVEEIGQRGTLHDHHMVGEIAAAIARMSR